MVALNLWHVAAQPFSMVSCVPILPTPVHSIATRLGKVQLCVRLLEQEEVAEPLLATGADLHVGLHGKTIDNG